MSTRKWGFVLIVVGLSGLALTSTGWAMAPPGRWTMPGWMSQMHSWMHGSIQGREGAPPPSPGATEVRVVARDFSFSPDEVTVPVGRTVNLTLVNEGDLPHDITIPALGFRLPAASGATASRALTVMRAGSYEFFCSIPGAPGGRHVGDPDRLVTTTRDQPYDSLGSIPDRYGRITPDG